MTVLRCEKEQDRPDLMGVS